MENLFNNIASLMQYVEGQNNYAVNSISLTFFEGRMYAESVHINEYGSSWANGDYQEVVLDERELHEVLELMQGENFVRIFEPDEYFNH